MKDFYKKLRNGEIKINDKTQLTDNEWLAFAVYYEFTRFVDWQNMAYHLEQTIEDEKDSWNFPRQRGKILRYDI